jgi:hypothetical protein
LQIRRLTARKLGLTTDAVLEKQRLAKIEFVQLLDAIKSELYGLPRDIAVMAAHAWHKGLLASLRAEYWLAVSLHVPQKHAHRPEHPKGKPGRKRKHPDTVFYARKRIRSRASAVLHASMKHGRRTAEFELLFGYSHDKLKRRLKSTMPAGYTWADYVACRLHVDHIIPVAAFNYSDVTHYDFFRAWHWKNLQLLPARENLRKSDAIMQPFQMALAF